MIWCLGSCHVGLSQLASSVESLGGLWVLLQLLGEAPSQFFSPWGAWKAFISLGRWVPMG